MNLSVEIANQFKKDDKKMFLGRLVHKTQNLIIEFSYNFLYIYNCKKLHDKKFIIYGNCMIRCFSTRVHIDYPRIGSDTFNEDSFTNKHRFKQFNLFRLLSKLL